MLTLSRRMHREHGSYSSEFPLGTPLENAEPDGAWFYKTTTLAKGRGVQVAEEEVGLPKGVG
jgi:hypothetical protein